ncbi:MAG TPA: hypothetical protein VFM80_10495 [Gracilimonas sp.]|uniref:hypothetical protein n=1 Tax=Gracilimonas sp. TaxID=1974203 RepID=UPI002DB14E94|nr:hypothetical protein [Gracilimonas sp.]
MKLFFRSKYSEQDKSHENAAQHLFDTLLNAPYPATTGKYARDRISRFYAALKENYIGSFNYMTELSILDTVPITINTNLAINQNTADHHGRT